MCIRTRIIGGARDREGVILRYAFRFYKLVERIIRVCLLGTVARAVHTVVRIFFYISDIVKTVLDILILLSVCVLRVYVCEPTHVLIVRIVRFNAVSVFDVHPLPVFVVADVFYFGTTHYVPTGFSHFGNPHSRRRSRSRRERSAVLQSGVGEMGQNFAFCARGCPAASVEKAYVYRIRFFLQLKRHDFEPLLNCQRTKAQNISWNILQKIHYTSLYYNVSV